MKKTKELKTFKTLAKQQALSGKGKLVVKGGTITGMDILCI